MKTTEDILKAKYLPQVEADADPEYVEWLEAKQRLDQLIEKRRIEREQQTPVEKSAGYKTSKLLEFK